ncbi:MAG: FtsX-like permease family protein [Casimicrobiaceae bacterium]|nr:FtsX-like permease family protein [Casimicrobiaceae bacterium]MDW8311162.1 FtsX-like permease family protein [Burkholderiales bacterium]
MNAALIFAFVRRELRTAEARILVLAIALAVASVGAVGLFAERVKAAFAQQANVLLGADAMIAGDRPLPASFLETARAYGLATTESIRFGSMVARARADGAESPTAVLVDVKAVAAPYPLRGSIELREASNDPQRRGARVPTTELPRPGEVFIDERLAERLKLREGDTLELGRIRPRVARVFVEEPEVAGNFLSSAPKLLMHRDDLAAADLLGPGSRASYRLHVAGARSAAFEAEIKPRLGPGQRLETVRELRPEVRSTLVRAEQFLGLSASFAVFLAVVAIVLALRRYLKRELDTAALFRTFGATGRTLLAHFSLQLLLLATLASLLGLFLAWLAQAALAEAVEGFFASPLPAASTAPLLRAFGIGLVLLLGFGLPPLVALSATPPLRALRRELPAPSGRSVFAVAAGAAAILAVVALQAQDATTGLVFTAALVALVAAASVLAFALLWLVRQALTALVEASGRLRHVRLGLANLERRRLSTTLQIACLGLGVMTLITVGFVRTDLFAAWQRSLPPDAPNRFLINIQSDQIEPLRALLAARGQQARFYPMVRARLIAINGRPVSAKDYADERAKRLIDREFNLSTSPTLPPGNQIVAGRYLNPAGRGEMSLEDGIAKTLGVALGDRVTFDAASAQFTLEVSSLRRVDWDSFRVNFFALVPEPELAELPKSYITAFHLPAEDVKTLGDIVAIAPNVLAVDVSEVMGRVRAIVEQAARALEFVFGFTLLAGLLTLYTAVVATQDERRYDTAVMRSFGGSRDQVRRTMLVEFSTLGFTAGLLGVIGAIGLTWALATRALNIEFVASPGVWLSGFVLAGLLTLAAGWLGTRGVLDTPPWRVLRENA